LCEILPRVVSARPRTEQRTSASQAFSIMSLSNAARTRVSPRSNRCPGAVSRDRRSPRAPRQA
jgi:hypothetical protein